MVAEILDVFSAYRLQSLIGPNYPWWIRLAGDGVFSAYRLQSLIGRPELLDGTGDHQRGLQRLSASVADRTSFYKLVNPNNVGQSSAPIGFSR